MDKSSINPKGRWHGESVDRPRNKSGQPTTQVQEIVNALQQNHIIMQYHGLENKTTCQYNQKPRKP
nr:hypothetical protein Q903MT_gene6608 [Picea sitchensis]